LLEEEPGFAEPAEEKVLFHCGLLRFCGVSYDGVIKKLLWDPRTEEWMREIGLVDGHREFRRIWEKADTAHAGIGMTEDAVAVAFAEHHGDRLRYDHDAGKWYQWTETHWHQERTKLAFSWARAACRSVAKRGEIANARGAAPLARAAAAAGVERFAQADRAFAVTSDIWDQDLMLLGTPGGTVDLTTGEMRPARPEDYITKQTSVAPAADVLECPLWDAFLRDCTGKDDAMICFLKQWSGYCLTGITHEHALVFLWGPGGNGKSVFINTLAHVMGDYAAVSSMDTFTASSGDRHTTDLAGLRGARLVTANETEEGRAWSETRVKQLTGGDKIAARFMHRDFFEYLPQFKLNVAGNNKPVLRNVDAAIKRRINMVPFINKPETPDKQLEQKLRAEASQILRWMIEGCLDWQKNGLVKPQVVVDATEEYFASQDHFGRWLDERCKRGNGDEFGTKPIVLLRNFQSWCEANGEPMTDNRQLRGMLERVQGVKYAKVKGIRLVRGVRLLTAAEMAEMASGQGGAR
jgi:putative DNA primase/helicase